MKDGRMVNVKPDALRMYETLQRKRPGKTLLDLLSSCLFFSTYFYIRVSRVGKYIYSTAVLKDNFEVLLLLSTLNFGGKCTFYLFDSCSQELDFFIYSWRWQKQSQLKAHLLAFFSPESSSVDEVCSVVMEMDLYVCIQSILRTSRRCRLKIQSSVLTSQMLTIPTQSPLTGFS